MKKSNLMIMASGLALAAASLAVSLPAKAQTSGSSNSAGSTTGSGTMGSGGSPSTGSGSTSSASTSGSGGSSSYGGNWSMYTPGSAYIGLNGGRSRFNGPSGFGGFANDRNGNAYSIYGGSFFNSNLGFELGYNDFGRVNRGGGTTRADGISLSLVGRVPLGQSFNLLGRLGGTYVSTDVSAAAASGLMTGRRNRFDLSYGIGAEFVFNPSWSAVVQYDEYNMRYPGNTRDRIDTTTIGVRYRF